MIFRSYTAWLIPVVTLLGFGSGAARATALTTTYPFNTTYEIVLTVEPVTSDVSLTVISGENTNAAYGLTNFISSSYSQFNPTTNVLAFSAEPTDFGLQSFPIGSDVYFGSGINKLFGTISGTSTFDFVNGTAMLSGTVNITDGEGIFTDATGTLTFTENDRLNPDPTAPLVSLATVNGSIEAVPEPGAGTGTMVAIGVIGAGFILGTGLLICDEQIPSCSQEFLHRHWTLTKAHCHCWGGSFVQPPMRSNPIVNQQLYRDRPL